MTSDLELILLGVALGAIPSAMLGRIMAAWLGKRAGVKPSEIAAYSEAADGDGDSDADAGSNAESNSVTATTPDDEIGTDDTKP